MNSIENNIFIFNVTKFPFNVNWISVIALSFQSETHGALLHTPQTIKAMMRYETFFSFLKKEKQYHNIIISNLNSSSRFYYAIKGARGSLFENSNLKLELFLEALIGLCSGHFICLLFFIYFPTGNSVFGDFIKWL